MHRLGYCRECSAMYESPVVTDGLCPDCLQAERPNDLTPDVETPWVMSKAAMRERLGVIGDYDE